MHGVSIQLAAFSLGSFAVVAALIPLLSDTDISRVVSRTAIRGRRTRFPFVFLGVQVAAACVLFAAGVRVHLVNDAIDLILTVAWLVALANAFRQLDNALVVAASVDTSADNVGFLEAGT